MRAMLEVCKSWNAAFKYNITKLSVAMPHYRVDGLPDMAPFQGLRSLTLTGSLLGIGLWSLQESEVVSLDLSGCSGVGSDFLYTLEGAPLTSLCLAYCVTGEICRRYYVMHGRLDNNCIKALSDIQLPLTALNIDGADVNNSGLEWLLGLKETLKIFTFMEFSAYDFSWRAFGALAQLTNLEALHLGKRRYLRYPDYGIVSRNDEEGHDFKFDLLSMFQYSEMKISHLHLDLQQAVLGPVGFSGLESIENMPLVSLEIIRCPSVTDEWLLCLGRLPLQHLKLHFSRVPDVTSLGWDGLRGLPLATFKLAIPHQYPLEVSVVSDTILRCLEGLPLTDLSLSNPTSRVTDEGMSALKGMPLTNLYLDNWSQVSDQGFAELSGMPLKKLEMIDCYLLTDAGLQILGSLSQLEVLDICGLPLITEHGVAFLHGSPVKVLRLVQSLVLSPPAYQNLLASLPNLRFLFVSPIRYGVGLGPYYY